MYNVTVNMFHVIRDIETVVLYVAAVIWGSLGDIETVVLYVAAVIWG